MDDDLEAGNRAERSAAAAAERATAGAVVVIALVSIVVIALVGWTGIVELDAQRRIAAEMLRLKEAAETANASKARFVAFLSHELRSPLTSVIGFSELLAAQSLGPIGHQRYAQYAESIRRGCEHLLELINDVLDLSKVDADRLTLNEQVFATEDLLEHCVGLLVPQASCAGIALTWSAAPAAAAIYGDPLRLRQIVTNLVANAIKYTPAGGSVDVRAEREPDGALRLTVRDTGIGIAEADLAIVLEPFRQVDNAANRSSAGTGLGLPLTRRLVELHGGRLSLESAVGAGTTAVVRLPAARVRDAA
jgi:signal transduction histidine kinase